jgi:polysaccharide export outer membrane protein
MELNGTGRQVVRFALALALACGAVIGTAARQTAGAPSSTTGHEAADTPVLPPGYVIGPEDVLSIVFWKDADMSATVVVRPDGKISLPLVNDIPAAGLTPEQLRTQLLKAAVKYVADPNATVVVKEIHSRKVFITGNVLRPGTFPLTGEMNVVQLISMAGGLQEYADAKNIVVMRTDGGRVQYLKFNYRDIIKQKNGQQIVSLKPGDTVVVP